ncbi:MFS transporter [Rhodothermus profundi]|uniref:Predicted arabinose efflux permease, MFS family n=1 Tax=Rhodothermus profundi TaxID=633813 RepID=A0A1M6VT50_9BACT|nr:MFS transporter [Rhodothermus profundi]SHK84591.1 Predicted arabinose efflux permease, MFS family [Rhodothermus profundi]
MDSPVRLGLRANWVQFSLLVVVNAFVGAMVGMERAILPLLAEQEFGLASRVATLSFVASFGLTKALANLLAGRLGDQIGRRRVLLAGWLVGLPVPWLLMWAPSWDWVVVANVLLGLNQGLAWSMTVIMKIDLVGPRQRGLAMGLNEAAGYLAVSLAALATGYVAAAYALRPQPFYLGVGFSLAGLGLSLLFVRETRHHAALEAQQHADSQEPTPSFREVFLRTSWRDRRLFAVCQAGLVNNLNDGMAWGLFPLFFAALGYSLTQIGWLAALYPAVWGLGQLITGALSDRLGRRPLIVGGMVLQGVSIGGMLLSPAFAGQAAAMVGLGVGTAMVYPTLLAVIGDVAHPAWRSTSVGVYRLWRDGGYVIGALLAGVLADVLSISWAIGTIAGLTLLSGGIAAATLEETRPPDECASASGVPEASAR